MLSPKWSICILTVKRRRKQFERLAKLLQPQVKNKRIEIIVCANEKVGVGRKRNACIEMACGEYVSFIDDDDLVAKDYVATIYPLLKKNVDYIGFRLQLYQDGERQKPTYHSIKYPEWFEDKNGYYRHISHLNPIKRSIAMNFRFVGNYAEDHQWSHDIYKSGLVNSEEYVDKVMYHYYHSKTKTLTGKTK